MITKEQAENYFYSKFKHPVCPFCQGKEWQIATYQNEKDKLVIAQVQDIQTESEIGQILLSSDNPPSFAGQAFISIKCANCNWIARFDYASISQEIKKHPKT